MGVSFPTGDPSEGFVVEGKKNGKKERKITLFQPRTIMNLRPSWICKSKNKCWGYRKASGFRENTRTDLQGGRGKIQRFSRPRGL